MNHKKFLFIVALMAVFMTVSGQDHPEHKVLFEKAKFTMETKGDLNGAIDLFNEIITKYPREREYAAKSQLYIGLCYEKLGLEEAQKAYRKVVENYPEQKQEVAMAKENLNRLLASMDLPRKPTFRKISIPTELSWSVRLSPDGKYLAQVSDKKLWSMPLEGNLGPGFSGPPVQINTEGTEVEWSGVFWSRDGKWIAFNESPETRDSLVNQWICVVPSGGGKPKKVIENFRDWRIVNYRISLSPDGKKLAFSTVDDDKTHIYTIPIEGGDPVQLTSMKAREPVFSPDGKMIAFTADRYIGRGEGDLGLWVVPAQGGTPHLVAEAGKASSPFWSPDGSMIAFLDYSDYSRSKQILIVRVDETGHSVGNPIAIDAPEGTSEVRLIAGWTPDNKIGALLVTEQEWALYTLPVQGGQAAMILRSTDAYAPPSQPRWSRDGNQIFYSTPSEGVNNTTEDEYNWCILASVSATGGKGKPLSGFKDQKNIRLFFFDGGNRISPDGKMIIAGAWTPEDISSEFYYPMTRIWKLAVDGSESIQITKKRGPFLDSSPCWSPDGKKIAFIRRKLIQGKTNDSMGDEDIYIVDSFDGEPELLDSVPGKSIFSLVWSPDGKMLACFTRQKESPFTCHIYIFNIENGAAVMVHEIQNYIYSAHSELAWSPDSKRIAFNFNDDENSGIKVMTLSDGSIEDIKTGLSDIDRIVHFDWSPDGERFVFAGWKYGDKEFWLIEDFLPEQK